VAVFLLVDDTSTVLCISVFVEYLKGNTIGLLLSDNICL